KPIPPVTHTTTTSAVPAVKKTVTTQQSVVTPQKPAFREQLWLLAKQYPMPVALGALVFFTLVVIAIAAARSGGSLGIASLPTATPTDAPTHVPATLLPTDIPPTATPTAIPCLAQAWWDTISASTASVVSSVQSLSIDLPPTQIKAGQTAFKN